jgi:hypothetical protein
MWNPDYPPRLMTAMVTPMYDNGGINYTAPSQDIMALWESRHSVVRFNR